MSNLIRAKRIDANQPAIVKALRAIAGVSVQLDMDDILVGYKGRCYWFEIKDPEKLFNKKGGVNNAAIKDSQRKLVAEFKGHYSIVWDIDQILEEIGIKKMTPKTQSKLREVLAAGFTIGKPEGVLTHVYGPQGKLHGMFKSNSEAINKAYDVMIENKSK